MLKRLDSARWRRPKRQLRGAARNSSLAMLAVGVLGCAPKHPENALHREATQFDRASSKSIPATFTDDGYFANPSDALSATASVLAARAGVGQVSKTSVSTNWTYGGDIGLDEQGEYFDQTRRRDVVTLTQDGAEVRPTSSGISGERRLRPNAAPTAWTEIPSGGDPVLVKRALAGLEVSSLGAVHVKSAASALPDFEAALPEGFTVTTRSATGFEAERVTTERKDIPRNGAWATWDVRVTLSIAITPEKLAVAAGRTEHRFSTAEGEGSWTPAAATDGAIPTDWLANALRRGVPKGREHLPDAQLPPVAVQNAAFSEAPGPPPLRTMDEIEAIIRDRAAETHTGNFRVCLDRVVVDPTNSSGYSWDLPGMGGAAPDIVGDVTIGGTPFHLPQQQDSFRTAPRFCDTANYRSDDLHAHVTLSDTDLEIADPIGDCDVDLSTVLTSGASAIPCGSAQLFMSAMYNFSFGQIKVVGLPPSSNTVVGVLGGVAMENQAIAGHPIDVYVHLDDFRSLAVKQMGDGAKGEAWVKAAEAMEFVHAYPNIAAQYNKPGNSVEESAYYEVAKQARSKFAGEGVSAAISVVHQTYARQFAVHSWHGKAEIGGALAADTYWLLKITISDPIGAAASESGSLKAQLGSAMLPTVLSQMVREGVEQKISEAIQDQGGNVLIIGD